MKLDKIRFARLISYLTEQFRGVRLTEVQIASIDEFIDVEVPQSDVAYPSTSDINMLMHLMATGTQKIEAIKLHRKLTGWGLKDSKDEVEKYWVSKFEAPKPWPRTEGADVTLGDILHNRV